MKKQLIIYLSVFNQIEVTLTLNSSKQKIRPFKQNNYLSYLFILIRVIKY